MRAYNAFSRVEQDAAILAFDRAGEQAIAAGADPQRVREVLRRHVSELALDDAGAFVLSIEVQANSVNVPAGTPAWAYMAGPAWAEAVRAVGDSVGGVGGDRAIMLAFLTKSETRAIDLVEGIKLLASDASPTRVLSELRAELAALKEGWVRHEAAELAARKLRAEALQRWERVNADRVRSWERLPHEIQLLRTVAHDHPEFSPILLALAEAIGKYGRDRPIAMLPGFRLDLAQTEIFPRPGPDPRTFQDANSFADAVGAWKRELSLRPPQPEATVEAPTAMTGELR